MNALCHKFTQLIRIYAFYVCSVRVTEVGGKTGPISMLVSQTGLLLLRDCECSDLEGLVAADVTPGISDMIRFSIISKTAKTTKRISGIPATFFACQSTHKLAI